MSKSLPYFHGLDGLGIAFYFYEYLASTVTTTIAGGNDNASTYFSSRVGLATLSTKDNDSFNHCFTH